MAEVKVVVKNSVQGSRDVQQEAQRWKQFTGTVETASKFLGAAAAGAALAWKTLGQGAELELARSRFENLAASIGTAADALENQLGQASRGMTTNAEDIASASQIISLGLADNQQDVVDLATLVSQLGWDMNQVILTFANNSKMRLDALGLSVTDVEDRMAELEAQGYDTDKAFDLAVIQAGQAKLELLGGAADTTAGAMERMTNRLVDSKNRLLEFIAVRSGPAFTGLMDYFDAVNAAQADMNDAVRLGIITQSEANTIVALAKRGYDEWQVKLREVRSEVEKLQPELEKLNELQAAMNFAAENSVSTLDDVVAMEERAAKARQQQTYMLQREEEQQRALGDALSGGALAFQENLDANRQAAAMAEAYTRQVKAQHDALLLTNQEQERLNALTGDYFTTAVNDGADALVSYNRTVTTTGGLTADQRANLDELTGAYERTQANIRSLTGGTAGLGLTQDELNKKLEEQYNQLGLLQGPMESLQQITSEVTGVSESYTYNQDAINRALYEAADAAGVDANSLAMLGIATGQLSEEQAVAALKAAALQGKIEELGLAIKNGMDPQTAINNLQTFQTHLDAQDFRVRIGLDAEPVEKSSQKVKEDLKPAVDDTITSVGDLATEFVNMAETGTVQLDALTTAVMPTYDQFVNLSGEVSTLKDNLFGLPEEIHIRIYYDTYGTPPSAPSGGSSGPGGNVPQGYATGGVVPGPIGRPQLAVVHGGEEVLTPSQRQERGRGNITISFAGAVFQGTSADTARQIVDTVAAKLGRL